MKIRYELTMDDLTAFSTYHCRHSPAARRTLVVWKWMIATLLFIVPLTCAGLATRSWSYALIGIVAALCFIVFTDPLVTRQKINESDAKRVLCEHELEVTDEGLVERTPYCEAKSLWPGIERIASTDDYTFIYIGATSAHVVPRLAVLEGNYDAFVETVRRKLNEHSDASDFLIADKL